MSRRPSAQSVLLSLFVASALMGGLPACTGGPAKPAGHDVQVEGAATALPDERVDEVWAVRFATEESIGPYVQEPGWVELLMKRNYGAAVRQLGPKGGLAAARAHAEAAAVFRQAALMASYSLIEVYGKTAQETDPAGAQHLLAVSYAVIGDQAAAKAASAKVPAGDPTEAWDRPWSAWLEAGGTWPPDLSGLPVKLPEPRVGEWPEPIEVPHYSLPEQGGSTAKRDMADPGLLVALALWHDAAANAAAGDQAAVVRSLRAAYRLPGEPPIPAAGPLPDELLMGGDLLVAGDGPFLADVYGPKGAAAVDEHASTSLLAEIAREARTDGKIDAQKAVDLVTALREQIVARQAARTGGNTLSHHRVFADIAYTGALRSLALVAEIEGDREASGLLRINALEHSEKHTACPVGLLALGAWDASNRYPLRAQDILHAQARRYPSLEIARYGLDVLGLRVNAERVNETPGM
ncbi:MAG: hypothetical protein H6738_06985 [Alphaproteobacteria bacterium]|nr:hypothetical protein [Alphaproteobacteria bacterium]MCB9696507.1 hypothetical protein [Alphaproteobacteria bacterium]